MKRLDGYYNSPRITYEVYDCSMPVTFDTFSNCGFGCLYCFATFQREMISNTSKYYWEKEYKAVNVNNIKRMFLHPEKNKQFGKYIQQRKVLQWGGMSDPFCWIEKQDGTGLELLRFFKEINYPLCFSTKGTWWLEDDRYTELFRGQKNWNVKFSIITNDAEKARVIEKGVPSPQERLKAINKVARLDCGGATLRLRPFMIGISSPGHVELIKQAGEAGATALTTEFFCLDVRSRALKERIIEINKQAGFDYFKLYKKFSVQQGYLRLNRNIKRPFVDEMEQACKDAGMRFYVSDAHFKERCNNGSCCGLPPDWNYSKGQFTEALMIAKKKGYVTWKDIAHEMEHLKGVKCSFMSEGQRVGFYNKDYYSYLRSSWNDPKSAHSPYQMFEGILEPYKLDNEKNVVYRFNKDRI